MKRWMAFLLTFGIGGTALGIISKARNVAILTYQPEEAINAIIWGTVLIVNGFLVYRWFVKRRQCH